MQGSESEVKFCSMPGNLRRIGCAALCLVIAGATAYGDSAVNAWTKGSSGSWEEPYWSLGTLPGPNQSILFTNAGWKALAIGANTAQNFPQSMQVQSLQIASPEDSYNVLLMNFSGFQVPLQT